MINHTIKSECSVDHWAFFNPANKKVLDLGCGRHDTQKVEDHSSTYFLQQGAESVLAIDTRQSEVDYFNSLGFANLQARCMFIDSTDVVKSLMQETSATAIKCDIEGWEEVLYNLSKEDMKQVVELSIEYHAVDIRSNIINKISEWGFNIIAEGKFGFVNAPQMGVLFARK